MRQLRKMNKNIRRGGKVILTLIVHKHRIRNTPSLVKRGVSVLRDNQLNNGIPSRKGDFRLSKKRPEQK